MGGGTKKAGPLGGEAPAVDVRGPVGLQAGSNAAQALPPDVPEPKDTADRRLYSYKEGKVQILFCRLAAPKPDWSWSIKKIRTDTKNPGQLGYTDISFDAAAVSIPKAETAGYFSGRAILKPITIRLPSELNVSDAQIAAAEQAKKPERVTELKAFKAAGALILKHELKHIDEAWAALTDMTLGWNKKLSGTSDASAKLLKEALDDSRTAAPGKITASATTFDNNDLGNLSSDMKAVGVRIDNGADKPFFYLKPQ